MLEITKEKKDDVFACIPDYVCVGERQAHGTHGCPSGVFSGMEMA